MVADFWLVVRFWATLFLVGAAAYPLTKYLFRNWYDQGYLLSKAVGMALVTYLVYLFGTIRILPFTLTTVVGALIMVFLMGVCLQLKLRTSVSTSGRGKLEVIDVKSYRSIWLVVLVEELFFFVALLFWAWIKAHEPSIRGLEKFMDFGFTKSILTHPYFPTPDIWYAGATINYYYFGHIVMALLTRLSGIDLAYTFNLMLVNLFALTLTMTFAIGYQVSSIKYHASKKINLLAGALTAFLVTLGGNLQTVYAFTKGYTGEDVKPFWELLWKVTEFWSKLPEGLNRYWYPNATRFIPYTIHEFPSYSFVVSDIHGHVLSIPFVLLVMALLIQLFGIRNQESGIRNWFHWVRYVFYGFLVAVLLMTNALDGPIYLGLFVILFVIHNSKFMISEASWWKQKAIVVLGVLMTAALTSLPFLLNFKSFVTGVAVNCPPAFLANSQIGPVIFEGVEKCQRSPLWMLLVLWGFFLYCGAWFIFDKFKMPLGLSSGRRQSAKVKVEEKKQVSPASQLDNVLLVFFLFSLGLIIFPEFFYFKDIYPAHFRSNTMFKLGYQAFMMFGIVSGYTIILWLQSKIIRRFFFIGLIPLLFLVSIYPIFGVRSYFNGLRSYEGLYGLQWLAREYPDDYTAIGWLNQEPRTKNQEQTTSNFNPPAGGQNSKFEYPTLVEADGDSYTDYNRFSVFTGIPTVVGWAVHEWLWRGSYNVVSPRREEVSSIYESSDLVATRMTLARYNVKYVVVGRLERQRYSRLQEWKFSRLGRLVYRRGEVAIYQTDTSGVAD